MAESSYPTIGHEQINAYLFPIRTTAWSGYTRAQAFARAQIDRAQTIGMGPVELGERKIYEIGRDSEMDIVPNSSTDKPVTIEYLEYGSMRPENLMTGRAYASTADIGQGDFDANDAECAVLIHKLSDASPAMVIESTWILRCAADSLGWSIPANNEDDIKTSVKLTAVDQMMTSNGAGMGLCDPLVASAGVLSLLAPAGVPIERDDWGDDDDGTSDRTVLTANPAPGATTLTVRDSSIFSVGHYILVKIDESNWETTRVASIVNPTSITIYDGLDLDYDIGAVVRRTRGFAVVVSNATIKDFLKQGSEYREKLTAGVYTMINVDSGSSIGATDVVWVAYNVAPAQELWTDNDTDLYNIKPDQVRFLIDSSADFSTETTGFVGSAVTEDAKLDFVSSGTDLDGEWFCYKFIALKPGKVKQLTALMSKTGTPVGEMYACIYNTNLGGLPDLPTGNPSNPVLISTFTASAHATITGATVTFTWTDGPEIVASGVYAVVFKTAGYTYAAGTTEACWLVDVDGDTAGDPIYSGDPNAGTIFVNTATENNGAEVHVTVAGAHELLRVQGLDISMTLNRTKRFETGSSEPISSTFEQADVTCNIPMYESEVTTLAKLANKNNGTVKTIRPEQVPYVYCRLEIYRTADKFPADILKCIEMRLKRTSLEYGASATDVTTKRVTMTGSTLTIASAL